MMNTFYIMKWKVKINGNGRERVGNTEIKTATSSTLWMAVWLWDVRGGSGRQVYYHRSTWTFDSRVGVVP